MATKKTKKWATILIAIAAIFILPPVISDFRLRGTWNGNTWDQLKQKYPGIKVSLFGNTVTVSSRPDLKGVLAGNTITWQDGSTWTRG